MWYRLSQPTQQQETKGAKDIVSTFYNNVNTILETHSGNLTLMAYKLADLARNTILPMGQDKSSLISQAIKFKHGDAGYPIEKSYNYYMLNPTAVPESVKQQQQQQQQQQTLQTQTPPPPGSDTQEQPPIKLENFAFKDSTGNNTPIGGQYGWVGPDDMTGDTKYNQGFQPIYKLGPDGKPLLRPDDKPIVEGFKYDGSKQTPTSNWNASSLQAAFKESGVQFVMGGLSKDHGITEPQKTQITQYLNSNKNEKNILKTETIPGLNNLLKTIGYKADADPGGVLFVEKA